MDSILGGFLLFLQVVAGLPIFLGVYYTFDNIDNILKKWGQTEYVIILFQGFLFVNFGCPLIDILAELLATDKLVTIFHFSFLLKLLDFCKLITININTS